MNKCRDCKHWKPTQKVIDALADYPRDQKVWDGWLDAKCDEIKHNIYAGVCGSSYLQVIETEANFGCVLFEQKEGGAK